MVELPSDAPVAVRDPLDVSVLVAYLRRETRDRPVLVLSVDAGQIGPYLPLDQAAKAAAGRADVVLIQGDDLTRSFCQSIADKAGVYRGACRVYPPGQGWEQDPLSTPLRMARNEKEIKLLPELVLADLHHAVDKVRWAAARSETTHLPRQQRAASHTPVSPPSLSSPANSLSPASPPSPASLARRSHTADLSVPPEIASGKDINQLVAYLRSPARRRPVVVISRATSMASAYADVDQAREDLAGLAEVFEITTATASWAFARAVPPMCAVYGGASRAYPLGTGWEVDPYSSPLRFAYSLRDRTTVTRQLVADAMSMAFHGTHRVEASPEQRRKVQGSVIGVVGDRGLVKLADGMAVLWPELVEPGLAAERLFVGGMSVTGELDPESRRIDVAGMRRGADEALSAYSPGDTILVRVAQVSPDSCEVELFPGVTATVPAEDVTEASDPDLRHFVSLLETLPALIIAYEAEAGWLLSLSEAEAVDEAVRAPSILVGGPAWLVPSPPAPPTPDQVAAEPLVDLADVLDPDSVRALQMENQQLSERLRQTESQVQILTNQLAAAKSRRRESVRRRSRADREADAQQRSDLDQHLFPDEADQLDFEIRLAWARMTQPSEKKDCPLKPWSYGPAFFATARDIQGVSRTKLVEVIVQVLTGRDAELDSRQRHQLRTGPGGSDPPRTREGGETCWRVSLQHKTPSARRLHYWLCNDGSIELASVRLHDDYET